MNLLDRYFLREFFKPFGVCLTAFLLCWMVYDLYDNINDFIEAGTSPGQILRYYGILLPAWLVEIMPITLLLSLLYVLSSMSKHGELTAMRASGLDFFRLMTPYFLIGICVSMQMLSLNLAWAPNALQKAKETFESTTRKAEASKSVALGVTYYDLAGNRFWTIYSLNMSQQSAERIEITQMDDKGRDMRKISAMNGSYRHGFWTLQDVIICDYTLPVSSTNYVTRLKRLKAREFTESPAQFILVAKKTKRMTTRELLDALRHAARLSPKHRAAYATEFQSRLAFPMANFVVFLIGVPFGVVRQRSSNFLAIVNALSFFFGYLLLAHIMAVLGNVGRAPPWIAAWLPNGLFALAGLWMIRKIR